MAKTDIVVPLKEYWALLVNYLKPQWPRVALLAALLFSSIGLQLVNPQILRHFIDVAKSGGALDTLINAALSFIGVALLGQLMSALATYFSEDVGWTATNLLRADLALHCLQLDLSFHKEHTPGELVERVDGDVATLSNFFSQFVIRVVGNGLLLVGILILLFREGWQVGLAMTAYVAVALTVLQRTQGIVVPHAKALRQIAADVVGFLEERLTGTEDIRANGAKAYVMHRLYRLLYALMLKGRKAELMSYTFWGSWIVISSLGGALAFAVGAYLYSAGAMTVGTVYLIFHYTRLLALNLEAITGQVKDLQQATAGIGRINELYRIQSKIQDGKGINMPSGPLAVEFQDVSFGYDEGVPVVKDISFRLEAGKVLGLLGRTGSGKTTLVRLTFRFYDPQGGTIRLGGMDIRGARVSEVRGRIGMATQEVQLFNATVRDNLTFFDDTVSDGRIMEALQELGLWEWFCSLPKGLDTELSSGGDLSAGEAQLLAFTRVFLKDPGLVILDEASSRLDPATERLIERATHKLLQNRTGIVIAHRLATVQSTDEIMIIEDGCIQEHGESKRLSADPTSRFYSLLQTGLEEVLA